MISSKYPNNLNELGKIIDIKNHNISEIQNQFMEVETLSK